MEDIAPDLAKQLSSHTSKTGPVDAVARQVLAAHRADPQGRIVVIGRNGRVAFLRMPRPLDATDRAAALSVGSGWLDAWPSETHPLIEHGLERAAAGDTVRFEIFRPTRDSASTWWAITLSPLAGAADRPVDWVLARLEDITTTARLRDEKFRLRSISAKIPPT